MVGMKKEDIIVLPHAHLRQRSKQVSFVSDEIKQLVLDMQAAALDWEASREHEVGVALAAIQVDKPLRIVIIRENFDDREDRRFHVYLNPEIIKYEGGIEEDFEGCLSVRDIYGKVPRHTKIRVKAKDINGREIRLRAEGFLARVFQHEVDHTNGKVFVDHIKDNPEAFYNLSDDGHLMKLEYEKDVKDNRLLWE